MKTRFRRGVALMLALWLIVLLGVLGARVVSLTRSSSGVASNIRARLLGRYAAESGIVLAVASMRDSLARLAISSDRSAYLNSLQPSSTRAREVALGDQRFSVVYVDVNSRIDVNTASQSQLTSLFSWFAGPADAAAAAKAVRSRVDGETGTSLDGFRLGSRRADLTYPAMPASRPLRTLEEMRRIPGVPDRIAIGAAPYLTVDGDGRINRAAASDTVLTAAAGSLVDEPSRILIVSRGWLRGHPLTHEIQAVYAIDGNSVLLIRWQERDL